MDHNQLPHAPLRDELPKPEDRTGLNDNTLGKQAVENLERAVYHEVTAGRYQDVASASEQLQVQKKRPDRVTKIGKKIGRLTGRVMTDEETDLVKWSDENNARFGAESGKGKARHHKIRSSEELERVRETLKLTGVHPMVEYLGFAQPIDESAPSFLREAKDAAKGEGYSWRKWLINDASDEQLANFLQWHVHETHKRQTDPEVQAEIKARRQEYQDAIPPGIKEGWLSPDAKSAVDEADGIEIKLGDIFELFMQGTGGYHVRGTGSITVSNPDEDIYHELSHATLGKLGSRWRDEAVTTHIERAIENGAPDVIDPSKREDEGEYEDERTLLTVALKGVPVSLATRAYSARGANKKVAESRLDEAVNRSWDYVLPEGKSVLVCIDKRVEQLEKEQLQEDDKIGLGIAQNRAILQVTSELQENPVKVFGKKEPKPEISPVPQFDAANMARIFNLNAKLAQRSAPQTAPRLHHDRTAYSPDAVSEVNAKVSALRTNGMSDKAIYREIAKELHPDTSGNDDREKIQYLNEWRDRTTSSETKQAA